MATIGKNIEVAQQLLEQGKLVAIPTETVYGLAGNAQDESSVVKIFQVKNRPQFDPLIVHVGGIDQALQYVDHFPEKALTLATQIWPGPLTLLLKKKPIIPYLVTSGLDTVGIRCPQHELTLQLLNKLSFPLAAPSANPFGYISPTSSSHVNDQLGDKIEYILDGGECKVGIESTIVGFTENKPVVYRLGGLSIERIENIIGPVTVQLNTSSNPVAPGQLKSHYAPRKKLLVGVLSELVLKYANYKIGVLCFQKPINGITNQRILSVNGSVEEAAKNIFAALRILDQSDAEILLAEEVPDHGLGRAINDRLRRASVG